MLQLLNSGRTFLPIEGRSPVLQGQARHAGGDKQRRVLLGAEVGNDIAHQRQMADQQHIVVATQQLQCAQVIGDPVGRITSYNVCYTKLLRIGDQKAHLDAGAARQRLAFLAQRRLPFQAGHRQSGVMGQQAPQVALAGAPLQQRTAHRRQSGRELLDSYNFV